MYGSHGKFEIDSHLSSTKKRDDINRDLTNDEGIIR